MASGKPFPFVGGAYTARSKAFDSQRCVNLYPEVSESGPSPSKSIVALVGTPGRKRWSTLSGGATRGLERFSASVGVAVVGPNVYRLDTSGNGTLIGTVPDDGFPVSMENNGSVVLITTTVGSVTIDPVSGKTTQLDVASNSVGYIDSRFVMNMIGTGQFAYSELASSIVNPLNFVTAEGAPDKLLALIVFHREVWLFGELTTEIYGPTGDAATPFARIGNAFIETGIAAPRSVAKTKDAIYWLTADEQGQGTVVQAAGYEPVRVSTHAVEFAIASYSRIDDAIAYTYQQEGHSFYVLTFPTAGKTWCFDARSGLWHERAYRRPADGGLEQVRDSGRMAFAGKVLVGDRANGNIYSLELDNYTDDGAEILRLRSCPHLFSAGKMQTFWSLELLMETGVGDGTLGQGSDPQVRLRWSDDGGASFRPVERWAPAGKIGERQRRVRWRRLGSAVDRVFEVSITDPVKVCIVGATANVTLGE